MGQAINIASKIVLVPLFLLAWGADIYGEWLLLSSMVAYLSLTEMGSHLYIVNRMTQAYAHRDNDQFRKILHTGLALFLIIPVAVFIIFVGRNFLFQPGHISPHQSDQPRYGGAGPGHPGFPDRRLAAAKHFIKGLLCRGNAAPWGYADQLHAADESHLSGRRVMGALGHGAHRHSPAHSLWAPRRAWPSGISTGNSRNSRSYPCGTLISLLA